MLKIPNYYTTQVLRNLKAHDGAIEVALIEVNSIQCRDAVAPSQPTKALAE